MVQSQTQMRARDRRAERTVADAPTDPQKTHDPRMDDTCFVDALCGAVVPQLVNRNGASLHVTYNERGSERRGDPLQACRVEEFVQLLLQEDDHGCEDFAFRQAASGADPQRMAADYLGPAARLIGDYWRMDICDFMQVTVCMTRIQRLFWQLVEECPPTREVRSGHSILLSPVPGDQHSFGQSVVEDLFRRNGWQVDSCCFDEEDHLYMLAGNNEYQIIGLSISGEPFLPMMTATAAKLRRRSMNAGVCILAGGSLVAIQPGAVLHAGADVLAGDAADALDTAETVVAGRRRWPHIASALG